MIKKQAILIIAHNNIWTLKKIIQLLDSVYFDIFIHIDKKSTIDFEGQLKGVCNKSNLYIYKEIDVRWASFTQVECELFLLEKAMKTNNYSYFHLISGVDMPLKPADELYEYFDSNYGKEYLHFESEQLSKNKLEWVKYYHFFRRIKRNSNLLKILEKVSITLQKVLLINRLRKTDKKFVTGANWFSITDKFATYVLDNKNFIYKTFKYTRSADEIFMQTLLYNSKYKENLYYKKFDNNYKACMRYIDWERGNPYVFRLEDYDTLMNQECLFARKFDENKDSEIINKIYDSIKIDRG